MKNKRRIIAVLLCLIMMLLVGCSGEAPVNPDVNGNNGDNGNDEEQVKIDIDFTRLSSTMQNAQLQIVLDNMQDYIGQTMKIRGIYDHTFWEVTGKHYHDMVIDCPTGCLKRIELFIGADNEFPEVGEAIEAVGVFGFYREDGIDFNFPYFTVIEIEVVE
jgi:hypothetical protein